MLHAERHAKSGQSDEASGGGEGEVFDAAADFQRAGLDGGFDLAHRDHVFTTGGLGVDVQVLAGDGQERAELHAHFV